MADDPLDALFALRPEDFTAARNDLARELRAAGERERAKQVAGLRRPTVAAWAVNQAVRADPDAFAALLEAGREVRRAQRRALSGMAGSGWREASRARREHIERLTATATRILAEAGGDPASHREDVAATFDAASATDEAGEQVAAARLERPLAAPSTFDDLAALSVVEDVEEEPAAEEPDVAGDRHRGEAASEPGAAAGEDVAEERRAAEAVAAMRRRADEASAARRRAHEQAEAARREAEAAAAEAGEAAAKAEEAAAAAERVRRESERARSEADRLRRRAEAARGEARQRADDAADADRVEQDRVRDLAGAEERLRSLRNGATRGSA